MTREDTKKMLMWMDNAFPNFKITNVSLTIDTWQQFLAEYPIDMVSAAMTTYIKTSGSGFAPSISQLIGCMTKAEEAAVMTEIEAWTLVRKAINRSIYYSKEEFDKLPELVKKTVGDPAQLRNWAMEDERNVETVIASNFQRTYRLVVERHNTMMRMPEVGRIGQKERVLIG